jgi:hypothetical protein
MKDIGGGILNCDGWGQWSTVWRGLARKPTWNNWRTSKMVIERSDIERCDRILKVLDFSVSPLELLSQNDRGNIPSPRHHYLS